MGRLARLDHRAEVVDPVEPRLVALEAGEQTVDAVRPLSDGLGELGTDELRGVVGGELVPVFVAEEGEVLLDVVAEDEDVRVLSAQRQQLFAIQVPDFVVVVLRGRGVTFMRSTE